MSDADRPSCRHGDSFSRECSSCRGHRVEAEYAARVSTLEARIAELTRERDADLSRASEITRGALDDRDAARARIAELERERDDARAQRLSDVMEGLVLVWDAAGARRETATARAERDEAVGLLREAPGAVVENDWERRRRALLARLAAAPEKETTPPGPYSKDTEPGR